jgi:hypothetical protein
MIDRSERFDVDMPYCLFSAAAAAILYNISSALKIEQL